LPCEYARERKKRGKASKKEIAEQKLKAAASGVRDTQRDSPEDSYTDEEDISDPPASALKLGEKRSRTSRPSVTSRMSASNMTNEDQSNSPNTGAPLPETLIPTNDVGAHSTVARAGHRLANVADSGVHSEGRSDLRSGYDSLIGYHQDVSSANSMPRNMLPATGTIVMPSLSHGNQAGSYSDTQFPLLSPDGQQAIAGPNFNFGQSPLAGGFFGQSPQAGASAWMALSSPSGTMYPTLHAVSSYDESGLKYPVLEPLLPYIASIMPVNIACELLEFYFSSTSSTFVHPQSPHVTGVFLRKRSFLRTNNPRHTTPALLASMLWVSAQTSDSAYLNTPVTARNRVLQQLLELCLSLLKPLVHGSRVSEQEGGLPGVAACVDDIATYIHLATVISASEHKAASIRWWNIAWTLARELKLGRELPPNPDPLSRHGHELDADLSANGGSNPRTDSRSGIPGFFSEEEREERRRIWWHCYIVDRHLALCYNRPLTLLDAECSSLLQPDSDINWQAGDYYRSSSGGQYGSAGHGDDNNSQRGRGPAFECTGHSIFGYFLPIATILGEIVELNQARNHPVFGMSFFNSLEWNTRVAEISQQLQTYGHSLEALEAYYAVPLDLIDSDLHREKEFHYPFLRGLPRPNPETIHHTKIVVAYGTHLMHTMHILLNGKWDPISLLDDTDGWIQSQSYLHAHRHAVSAAEAINAILDYDPDLSFMPWFFGIYLLQASFLLLLIADQLQIKAQSNVVRACEVIIRAHEACVATLSTEYQRNFRKVMRSALAPMKGRMIENPGENQNRRREVLGLYRWTPDGTGLAL
jgi:hypothetical protein